MINLSATTYELIGLLLRRKRKAEALRGFHFFAKRKNPLFPRFGKNPSDFSKVWKMLYPWLYDALKSRYTPA